MRSAGIDAEARGHLVEDQRGAAAVGERSDALDEGRLGLGAAHRLHHDRREPLAMFGDDGLDLVELVEVGSMSTLNCAEDIELAELLIELHP